MWQIDVMLYFPNQLISYVFPSYEPSFIIDYDVHSSTIINGDFVDFFYAVLSHPYTRVIRFSMLFGKQVITWTFTSVLEFHKTMNVFAYYLAVSWRLGPKRFVRTVCTLTSFLLLSSVNLPRLYNAIDYICENILIQNSGESNIILHGFDYMPIEYRFQNPNGVLVKYDHSAGNVRAFILKGYRQSVILNTMRYCTFKLFKPFGKQDNPSQIHRAPSPMCFTSLLTYLRSCNRHADISYTARKEKLKRNQVEF